MKVLLTGATGYIGAVVAEKLIAAGHSVAGIARSDESSAKLSAAGVEPIRGSVDDAQLIARHAQDADGFAHLAVDYSLNVPALDTALVDAVSAAYAGTGKPLVYTSGVWVYGDTHGEVVDEDSALNPPPMVAWRPAVEQAALASAASGVRGIVIRPAMVSGRGGGLLDMFTQSAMQHGSAQYIGSGANFWSLVDVDDLADLYVLAIEHADAVTVWNGAAGEPVAVRDIAAKASTAAGTGGTTISVSPEDAAKQLGPMVDALTMSQKVSGKRAESVLGWKPFRPAPHFV